MTDSPVAPARALGRIARMLHLALVVALLLSLGSWQVALRLGAAMLSPTVRLWLLSLPPGQEQRLATLPLTVHARLFADPADHYVVSGAADALRPLQEAGFAAQQLDANTQGQAYYRLTLPKSAPATPTFGAARLLYRYGREVFLAVPAATEAEWLAQCAQQEVYPLPLRQTSVALTERPLPASSLNLATAPDPAIVALLSQVSETMLYDYLADLTGARPITLGTRQVTLATRYTRAAQIADAEEYLTRFYQGLGLEVHAVPWSSGSLSGRNIIADLRGHTNPQRVWLVGGHFDSRSENPYVLAPGADDNASGIVATMAIAAVLAGHPCRDTLRFVNFSGEEQGMYGSRAYADALATADDEEIMGYLNMDMVAWEEDGDLLTELHAGRGASSQALAAAFVAANARYAQGLTFETKTTNATRSSDHSSFWDEGYASFLVIENVFDDAIPADTTPYYHRTGDTLASLTSGGRSLAYMQRITRTALATVAEWAGYSAPLTITLPLLLGWNLLSLPLAPADARITQTLASIAGSYRQVYAHEAFTPAQPWRSFVATAPPYANDLATLHERLGFWVEATRTVTLTLTGQVVATATLPLTRGWNLVGYPCRSTQPLTTTLASIAGSYDAVHTLVNATWRTYTVGAPSYANTLTTLTPGQGYWLHATRPCTWAVPCAPSATRPE